MIRAVLATNTIVSAVFWRGSPRQVYQTVLEQQVKPIVSELLLMELDRVLHYEKFVNALAALGISAEDVVSEYRELAETVIPTEIPPDVVRDSTDQAVLACAIAGKVDFIISGDKDLLVLSTFENIPIVSANQFLERLPR